jgi:cell division protein FtsL
VNFGLKDYLLIIVLVALLVVVVLWGIQKRRADSLTAERDSDLCQQKRDKVEREYIPMKLEEKRSNELTGIGVNLWGE